MAVSAAQIFVQNARDTCVDERRAFGRHPAEVGGCDHCTFSCNELSGSRFSSRCRSGQDRPLPAREVQDAKTKAPRLGCGSVSVFLRSMRHEGPQPAPSRDSLADEPECDWRLWVELLPSLWESVRLLKDTGERFSESSTKFSESRDSISVRTRLSGNLQCH